MNCRNGFGGSRWQILFYMQRRSALKSVVWLIWQPFFWNHLHKQCCKSVWELWCMPDTRIFFKLNVVAFNQISWSVLKKASTAKHSVCTCVLSLNLSFAILVVNMYIEDSKIILRIGRVGSDCVWLQACKHLLTAAAVRIAETTIGSQVTQSRGENRVWVLVLRVLVSENEMHVGNWK